VWSRANQFQVPKKKDKEGGGRAANGQKTHKILGGGGKRVKRFDRQDKLLTDRGKKKGGKGENGRVV